MQPSRLWNADITAWVDKVGVDMDALARQTVQEVASRVVAGTPVDTGFLRGSWQPSINGQPGPELGDAAPLAVLALVCTGIEGGDYVSFTNNAAYAMRLEFGFVGPDARGRTYAQRGRFFVTDVMDRWQSIAAEVARDLRMSAA